MSANGDHTSVSTVTGLYSGIESVDWYIEIKAERYRIAMKKKRYGHPEICDVLKRTQGSVTGRHISSIAKWGPITDKNAA